MKLTEKQKDILKKFGIGLGTGTLIFVGGYKLFWKGYDIGIDDARIMHDLIYKGCTTFKGVPMDLNSVEDLAKLRKYFKWNNESFEKLMILNGISQKV